MTATLALQTSSTLIALDATPGQISGCSPPGDMLQARSAHMLQRPDGHLIACGGNGVGGLMTDCEEFDSMTGNWNAATYSLGVGKGWFPTVQLDDNRIWIGRRLSESSVETCLFRK